MIEIKPDDLEPVIDAVSELQLSETLRINRKVQVKAQEQNINSPSEKRRSIRSLQTFTVWLDGKRGAEPFCFFTEAAWTAL